MQKFISAVGLSAPLRT